MEKNQIPFTAFLTTAFDKGDYTTDDSIAFVLPLFRKVLGFHEAGWVAPFDKEETLFVPDHSHFLDIDEAFVHAPANELTRVNALFPRRQPRGLDLVHAGIDPEGNGIAPVHTDLSEPLQRPVWLPDRKSTRLNSSHRALSRMPSSA